MAADCPHCGLHFERMAGYWLGAMALNLVVNEVVFVVALVVQMTASWPDVPWTRVLVVGVTLNVLVPLAFYPISRTVWVAAERHLSSTWNESAP